MGKADIRKTMMKDDGAAEMDGNGIRSYGPFKDAYGVHPILLGQPRSHFRCSRHCR